MTYFINKTNNSLSTTLLKKSYKSRYIHTRYLYPTYRNSEDISDIETNFGKINNNKNNNKKIIKNIIIK